MVSSRSQAAQALVAPATRETQWWREMVLYENHLPSVRDGSGDGIGDLEGLIQSLDYLARHPRCDGGLGRTLLPLARSSIWASTSPTTWTSSRCSATWPRSIG